MLGKKSGLNLGLRKILAKIAKEFDFPRVVAVRCRMEVAVRDLAQPVDVTVAQFQALTTTIRTLATSFPIECRSAVLQQASCNAVAPLEQMKAEVCTIDCFVENSVQVVNPALVVPEAKVQTMVHQMTPPAIKSPVIEIQPPDLRLAPLIKETRVRGGAMLARTMPFHLPVLPIRGLNMKLVIRYRAAVLKQLNISPTLVKFIGVVRNLPKAPLRVLKYEEGTRQGGDQVLVRLQGGSNPHFGQRAWVFVQLKGKIDYMPVTIKEEDP